MSLFRSNIDAMSPYVPGEQPGGGRRVIKLNTNENAYPPTPRLVEVLGRFDPRRLRVYPDQASTVLRAEAAKVLGVPTEWILPGNGSDDLLVMIARAALGPSRRVAYPVPTFEFYETQALIEDAERLEIPYDEDYRLPVDALAGANADVTFVANPNSPTGAAVGNERLAALAEALDGLLVIDEAYADFTESSAVELVGSHPNVVVLRTLSKGYSLAGLRVGFGVARPETLAGLGKTKQIYNLDILAMHLAAAALGDQEHKNANARRIVASRRRLAGELEGRDWRVWDSQANFLFARPPVDAAELMRSLRERGILVRHFAKDGIEDKLRITIGTDEENAALLRALDALSADSG